MTKRWAHLSTIVAVIGGLVVACSSENDAPAPLCPPLLQVYCRCQDRQEGTKRCAADGNSYGPCVPCETADNPEDTTYNPASAIDAGSASGLETVADNGPGPCGDGIVNTGEECDVRDAVASDGCDATCKLSGTAPPATTDCPGLDVHLWKDGHLATLTSTTSGGGTHRTSKACGAVETTGATATDRVFHVAVHASGTLKVGVTGVGYNAFLWSAAKCGDSVAPLACANDASTTASELLTMPVIGGHYYYVFVDGAGASNNAGTFTVTFGLY